MASPVLTLFTLTTVFGAEQNIIMAPRMGVGRTVGAARRVRSDLCQSVRPGLGSGFLIGQAACTWSFRRQRTVKAAFPVILRCRLLWLGDQWNPLCLSKSRLAAMGLPLNWQ